LKIDEKPVKFPVAGDTDVVARVRSPGGSFRRNQIDVPANLVVYQVCKSPIFLIPTLAPSLPLCRCRRFA